MRLFFQQAREGARPWQSRIEVVDPEEQEEAIARFGDAGTCQRGVRMDTPLVKTEQDRSIGVEDLPEIAMSRRRFRQPKKQLVPPEA